MPVIPITRCEDYICVLECRGRIPHLRLEHPIGGYFARYPTPIIITMNMSNVMQFRENVIFLSMTAKFKPKKFIARNSRRLIINSIANHKPYLKPPHSIAQRPNLYPTYALYAIE